MAQKFLSGPFFNMLVRLAGIEPTTPWFVAKYSIQLSYSRDKKEYISFGRNGQAAMLSCMVGAVGPKVPGCGPDAGGAASQGRADGGWRTIAGDED
jgi:hypothetical protein